MAPVSTYTDRPHLREKLEELLHHAIAYPRHKPRTVIVHGIGGAGKTQLVLDYIQRHREDYSAVFWVEATGPESIQRDYVQIYMLLYGLHADAGQMTNGSKSVVSAVKRWFYGRGKRWLFIFDNADSISNQKDPFYVDLRHFLPDDSSLDVIVTTRDQSAQEVTDLPAIEVEKMTHEEAVSLFQTQAKIHSVSQLQVKEIDSIVRELGHFALAITLAGSYVAATPRLRNDLARFLPEYRERRNYILAQRPSWLVHQYGESVLTTWETTLRAVDSQSPEAGQFLVLLSFFSHEDIPTDFPTDLINSKTPLWLSILLPDKQVTQYDVEAFFRILASFSFVKYRDDQNSYVMHSLVQAWAYDRLEEDQQRHFGSVCADLLRSMTANVREAGPVVRRRLIPHVLSSFRKISRCYEHHPVAERSIITSLAESAIFLGLCGLHKDQILIEKFIVRKCQTWYGDNDRTTLTAMYDLSVTLADIREYKAALPLQRVVYRERCQQLGEDDSATLAAEQSLAVTLSNLGEPQEALPILRRVLEKRTKLQGEDDPRTLATISQLANTLTNLQEHQEATTVQREVFQKRRRVLGESHPLTLRSMFNVATSLFHMDEWQESKDMFRFVVDEQRRILGEDHPDTIFSWHYLSVSLANLHEIPEAISIQRKVLSMRRQALGETNLDTISSLNSLSRMLRYLGEAHALQEAVSLQQESVARHVDVFGAQHPDTVEAREELGVVQEELYCVEKLLPLKTQE